MMNRQEFLKSIALSGAAAVGMNAAESAFAAGGKDNDLVAVMGGEPGEMFDKAIEAMGGMDRFVKKGDKVVIKPNIGWDAVPEKAADTNPDLIGALVRACLNAGAKEVSVFDHTCDSSWRNCYKNSGIEKATIDNGGTMLPGNDEVYYEDVKLPKGVSLKETKIHKSLLDCDVWFNVPVLKNHGGAKMTIAMKNLLGIVWDRRYFHQNNLQQCIADICTFAKKPVLNIVDAYRLMQNNGPRGRSLDDAVMTKALFMSTDIVAIDTVAVKFFNQVRNMPLDEVKHIAMGQDLGLGTMDVASLKTKRIKL